MNPADDATYIEGSSRVFAFFGTKQSGNAKEPDALARFLHKKHKKFAALIQPQQNHGTTIAVVDGAKGSMQPEGTDGLITRHSGIMLSVKTADCVPVIYIDPEHNIIGISHQGWQGTLHGMAERMIKKLCEQGADLSTLQCSIGPCIAGVSYTVQKERADLFREKYPDAPGVIGVDAGFQLDLRLINRYQLEQQGILPKNIQIHPDDTFTQSDRYYSYRREYPSLSGQMFHAVVQYHDE